MNIHALKDPFTVSFLFSLRAIHSCFCHRACRGMTTRDWREVPTTSVDSQSCLSLNQPDVRKAGLARLRGGRHAKPGSRQQGGTVSGLTANLLPVQKDL